MGRKRGLRVRHGLPRGGLGQLGWAPLIGALAATWFAHAELAAAVSVLAVPLCVWCALGLRADDAAGEAADHYVDDESLDWKELLSGNFEHPVRRQSTVMIVLSVLVCVLALCRWRYGWGPFA
jgi:hypothetical protein